MFNKKIISLSICIVLLSAIFSGCIEPQAGDVKVEIPQELTIAVPRDIGRDPHYGLLGSHVYETLVGVAIGRMEPEPLLATHWKVSDDGLTWTFYLREGVKFHDGTAFTAEAVKISFERILKIFPVARGILKIESMEIVDNYTIKITTTEPWAALPAHLSHPVGQIMSPASINKECGNLSILKHTGTGPFKFYERVPEERVVVVRNEAHWKGSPKLEKITYVVVPDSHTRIMALEAGEVDVIQGAPEVEIARLDAHIGITALRIPSVRTNFVVFNTETKPFSDIRVRQAVDYAINQRALVRYILDDLGVPARGAISPAIRWSIHDELPEPKFNPEKARTLLAEAGWKDTDGNGILDKDGESFSITLLLTGVRHSWSPMAEVIQSQLKEVGIDVRLKVLEGGAFNNAVRTPGNRPLDIHMFFGSAGTWAGDADYIFNLLYHTNQKSATSMHLYEDELIEKGLSTMNDNERFAIWRDMQRIILEKELCIFLYHEEEIIVIRDHVHGFQVHPNQRMDRVPLWKVYVTG